MPEQIKVTVSIPPRCLSPNSRAHWRTTTSAKKRVRNEMALMLRLAIAEAAHWPYVRMDVEWIGKTANVKRMDSDNAIATLKTHIDCLQAHGLIMNDHTVRIGTMALSVDKTNPRLIITLTREDS